MIFNNVSFKWIISISSQYLISYRNQSFDLHCKSNDWFLYGIKYWDFHLKYSTSFHVKSNTGLDNGIRYWALIVEKICEWNWLITETFLLFIRPSLFTFHTAIHSPPFIRLKYSNPTLPYNFCFPTENMQTSPLSLTICVSLPKICKLLWVYLHNSFSTLLIPP